MRLTSAACEGVPFFARSSTCAGRPCSADSDCDDGVFCNGEESCDGELCAPGTPPCPDGCDEESESCTVDCAEASDLDRDGVDSIACGGDDCDDADPLRYPGNPEICDPLGRDEDCDPDTLGPDADGDGFPGLMCCYDDPSEGLVCGADCNDARSGVNPGAIEVCNELDDDCDGSNDEGVLLTFYRDVDGDGFGIEGDTQVGCSTPAGYAVLAGDCNDALPGINPGVGDGPTGACDDVDNNCDDTVDEGCDCTEGDARDCGPTDAEGMPITTGNCTQGRQSCNGGAWGECVGDVGVGTEICNGMSEDEDCDGMTDETFLVTCYRDDDDDGYPVGGASATDVCRDPSRGSVGECPTSYTDRAPGSGRTDCNDGNPDQNPGRSEGCANGLDDNCNGTIDENCACTGCTCSGVTVTAVRTTVTTRDSGDGFYAGYRFGWVIPDAMGRPRVDIACASSGTLYHNDYVLSRSGENVIIVGANNHEIRATVVSAGCCSLTLDLYITR